MRFSTALILLTGFAAVNAGTTYNGKCKARPAGGASALGGGAGGAAAGGAGGAAAGGAAGGAGGATASGGAAAGGAAGGAGGAAAGAGAAGGAPAGGVYGAGAPPAGGAASSGASSVAPSSSAPAVSASGAASGASSVAPTSSAPAASASASALTDGAGNAPVGFTTCSSIWNTISADLTTSFVSGGQCTDLARAAIRYAFHDAGTFALNLPTYSPASGGADASLLLVPSEINRPENFGLQSYHTFLTAFYAKYRAHVGAADLVYFAGNHAVVSCPGGPAVKTVVGRKDARADQPSPTGVMPPGAGPGSDHNSLLALFENKGFDARDLAALVGAHSTSKAFGQQGQGIPVGGQQDSTPGVWDVKFYGETYAPPSNVFRFQSDINLSNKTTAVGKEFSGFVNNQGKWNGKFADAMFRLSILGIPSSDASSFADCTDALPRASRRRSMWDAPYNNRAR